MGDVVPFRERPLQPVRAMARIRQLWVQGSTSWDTHFEDELESDGLEISDIRRIILRGQVTETQAAGQATWRYVVTGPLLDGKVVSCVVEINGLLVFVTAFRV
jgi:hypothetical protein